MDADDHRSSDETIWSAIAEEIGLPALAADLEVDLASEKMAVYCDDAHQLHVVSPVCTHLKCIVHWNQAERSWDCPCHGSHFSYDGEILEGPAIAPLQKRMMQPFATGEIDTWLS